VRLFIIVLVSMLLVTVVIGATGLLIIGEIIRYFTYCMAQGGRC